MNGEEFEVRMMWSKRVCISPFFGKPLSEVTFTHMAMLEAELILS